jgi:UDP-N-acetylglucosamine 4,6-dehydratase
MNDMYNNKIILVTGGTGSWGHELVTQLLKYHNPKEVRIYSRGEYNQVMMKIEFNNDPRLRFIIGDVRNKTTLSFAMQNVDIVFHLAALKQVPVCEENCWESVLTNVYGTQNVIESALKNNVKLVVETSTDKAVEPLNFYGITKATAERLISNVKVNHQVGGKTKFVCIRAGNVLGTQGSVIPIFKEQLRKKNEVTLTDGNMTRYLLSKKDAIGLVFKAVEVARGGEIFVMRMPSTNMNTLTNVMIKLFGNENSKINEIGIRPGEKIHELLVSRNESYRTKVYDDKYYVILPTYHNDELEGVYNEYKNMPEEEFNSTNTHVMDEAELETMLRREEWLFDNSNR